MRSLPEAAAGGSRQQPEAAGKSFGASGKSFKAAGKSFEAAGKSSEAAGRSCRQELNTAGRHEATTLALTLK